jgi:hypothetical protein
VTLCTSSEIQSPTLYRLFVVLVMYCRYLSWLPTYIPGMLTITFADRPCLQSFLSAVISFCGDILLLRSVAFFTRNRRCEQSLSLPVANAVSRVLQERSVLNLKVSGRRRFVRILSTFSCWPFIRAPSHPSTHKYKYKYSSHYYLH